MKTRVLLFSILLSILLISCRGNIMNYDAMGSFEANEITVSSEASGRILSLNILEGDKLIIGDRIGEIDSMQLVYKKELLQKGIKALYTTKPDVDIQLAPLYEQLEKLNQDKKRVEALFADQSATQKQLDDINSAIIVAEKQVESQKNILTKNVESIDSQVDLKRTELAQLEDMLAKTHIKSPISGTVLAKYAHEGELTATGKPLFKIADVDNIYFKAYFTSDQLVNMRLGDQVSVFADFGNGKKREYKGKIIWISDKSEFTPKNIITSNERASLVYAVKISLQNDGYIKIGMYGEVKL